MHPLIILKVRRNRMIDMTATLIVHEDVVHVHMTDRKYNLRYLTTQNFQFCYKNGMIK